MYHTQLLSEITCWGVRVWPLDQSARVLRTASSLANLPPYPQKPARCLAQIFYKYLLNE